MISSESSAGPAPTVYPTLRTRRLVLRAFEPADAPVVQRLAGAAAVADTTLNIPHPYPDGAAEAWIQSHAPAWARRTSVCFAITEEGELRGAISFSLSAQHQLAELGYWIGEAYWGRGLATEAARAMVDFAFEVCRVNRVQALHYARNPASGRVLEKVGMVREGVHRERIRKGDRFEDVVECAILRRDWRKQ